MVFTNPKVSPRGNFSPTPHPCLKHLQRNERNMYLQTQSWSDITETIPLSLRRLALSLSQRLPDNSHNPIFTNSINFIRLLSSLVWEPRSRKQHSHRPSGNGKSHLNAFNTVCAYLTRCSLNASHCIWVIVCSSFCIKRWAGWTVENNENRLFWILSTITANDWVTQ